MNEILYQRYVCDPKNNEDEVVTWDGLPFHEYPELETLFGENPVEKKQPNPKMLLKLKKKCPVYWKNLFENENQLDSFFSYISKNPDGYSVMLLQTLFESVDKEFDKLTLLLKKLDEIYLKSFVLSNPVCNEGFFEELLSSRKQIYKKYFEKTPLETAFEKVLAKEWVVLDFYITQYSIDVDKTAYNEYKIWSFELFEKLGTPDFWNELICFSLDIGISTCLEQLVCELSNLTGEKIRISWSKRFYDFLFVNYVAMENNPKDILEAVQMEKMANGDEIAIKKSCAEYVKELADDDDFLEILYAGKGNDIFDDESLDQAIDILLEKEQLDKVPGIILIKFGR